MNKKILSACFTQRVAFYPAKTLCGTLKTLITQVEKSSYKKRAAI